MSAKANTRGSSWETILYINLSAKLNKSAGGKLSHNLIGSTGFFKGFKRRLSILAVKDSFYLGIKVIVPVNISERSAPYYFHVVSEYSKD